MIDFTNIKGETVEGQRSFFEQLVCHLARLDNACGGEFRRIEGSGGDGGVEALRVLSSGQKVGYQAKYYTSQEDIDWGKLDSSVKAALSQHPELERYVIALPCDFTGKRATRGGSSEGAWGKWDERVKRWQSLAMGQGTRVEFQPWTGFELEVALLRPSAQHLIRFFFDQLTFTREWLQRNLDRTIHDLQARYSPGEHVDTRSLRTFDVIYRRDNVRQDLRGVFETSRSSNARAAVTLIDAVSELEELVIAVEDSQSEFLALEAAIDWHLPQPWPVCNWFSRWHSFTRKLLSVDHSFRDRPKTDNADDSTLLHKRLAQITQVSELIVPEVFGGRWAYLLPIDGSRAALLVGRAGAGKSHVLARGSEIALNAGAPVVHVLGQHILDDDPRVSILKRLELTNWTFHDVLSALNLSAEAADTRAMLVIDALNEGRGTDVWRNHMASFVHDVTQHDRIVLVVSCREEYLDYVIPSNLIAKTRPYPEENGDPPADCAPLGKLVQHHVEGFQTSEERELALQKFMDEKGIARPTAPVLDAEFFNPLFMSSVCRSMAKAGVRVFPRGLHGAREIFGFVLKTKAKSLGTHHDGTERVLDAMKAALNDLAGVMVERRKDKVPLDEASNLVDSAFKALPITGQTWLDVLEGSDILRRDVEQAQDIGVWSKPNEVIRFSFQRLQDNLIAERLIRYLGRIDVEDAFETNGPFAFLVNRSTQSNGTKLFEFGPRWIGVIGALWSAVSETYGKELWDLRSFFGGPDVYYYPRDFRPVFRVAIRERKGSAFTARTKEALDLLWKDEQEEKLAILLSTACVPEHSWNADFLAEQLLSLSDSNRNSAWSAYFTDTRSELVDRTKEITNWAVNVDSTAADSEVVRLAGITLTCLFIVENPTIRGAATNALANLLAGAPALHSVLKDRFRAVEDRNLQECLFAAGA